MDFLTALRAASGHSAESVRVFRPDGPAFLVDHLGAVTPQNDCAYLGDFLDLDDWQVEAVAERRPMPDGADPLHNFMPRPRPHA